MDFVWRGDCGGKYAVVGVAEDEGGEGGAGEEKRGGRGDGVIGARGGEDRAAGDLDGLMIHEP